MVLWVYFNGPFLNLGIPELRLFTLLEHGVISVPEFVDVGLTRCNQLIEGGNIFFEERSYLCRKPIKFESKGSYPLYGEVLTEFIFSELW